jgi:HD-GYP domain-containing protein (c-di-GMP phosphodiesterase class II)
VARAPEPASRIKGHSVEHSPRVIATVLLLVGVCTAIIALLGPSAGIAEPSFENMALAVILATLIICADFFEIDAPLASARVTVSVSAALCFAAAISLGPVMGAAVAGVGALVVEIVQRTILIKAIVNIVNYVFATFVAGYVYLSLADVAVTPISSLENFLATILAASVCTLINTGIISLVVSQVLEQPPLQLWFANFRGAIFEHISLPTLGVMIPVLYRESIFALILAVIPLLGPYLAFRNYRQVHEETRATLNVLADMLDRRDPYTAEHSQRVCDLVEQMLRRYPGISFDDFETVTTAARIHDLGKVTTSDATLLKPGRLEPHEFEEMKRHSVDGSEIMQHISIFEDVSKIIRHHHERWDGRGYPDGISGEAIPIGSRLIAVADTYDAMTTDRPYRAALSHEVAVEEIRRNAGAQFEPEAVRAFLQAINEHPEFARSQVAHEMNISD